MNNFECKDWNAFKQLLSNYASRNWRRRDCFLFRGQYPEGKPLLPLVDRTRSFDGEDDRLLTVQRIVRMFQLEVAGEPCALQEGDRFELWEMLARHHGLPTRLLDWTLSPYMAAFFAFDGHDSNTSPDAEHHVEIWMLDRELFAQQEIPEVDVLEASWHTNRRARSQRSVFTMTLGKGASLQDTISGLLTKFTIPATERKLALDDLDEMNINPSTMYPGLDGAASTVRRRLEEGGGK